MRPAAPYGDLRGRDGLLTPFPCAIPVAARVSPSRGRGKGWGFERHPPFFRNLPKAESPRRCAFSSPDPCH